MGGEMDGMADMNNAPMPPMGTDGMGMEDQNAIGGEMPMDNQDPMSDEDPNVMNGGGEDDELMNIINNLSIEDKAAVTKYAKSMADGSEGGEDPNAINGEMPMESFKNIKNIIDETINDILDDNEGTKRQDKKMPRQYKSMTSPFKSPFSDDSSERRDKIMQKYSRFDDGSDNPYSDEGRYYRSLETEI